MRTAPLNVAVLTATGNGFDAFRTSCRTIILVGTCGNSTEARSIFLNGIFRKSAWISSKASLLHTWPLSHGWKISYPLCFSYYDCVHFTGMWKKIILQANPTKRCGQKWSALLNIVREVRERLEVTRARCGIGKTLFQLETIIDCKSPRQMYRFYRAFVYHSGSWAGRVG